MSRSQDWLIRMRLFLEPIMELKYEEEWKKRLMAGYETVKIDKVRGGARMQRERNVSRIERSFWKIGSRPVRRSGDARAL